MAANEAELKKKQKEEAERKAREELEQAVAELQVKLEGDIFAGIITRGAALVVCLMLFALITYAAWTKLPVLVESLLTRFLG
ncbi:MAG: hypothetical protein M5R36_02085 [Deltaproteobacteria bacterium]|nr:hypothetical protein [Deltaproteobacteria bacterium]